VLVSPGEGAAHRVQHDLGPGSLSRGFLKEFVGGSVEGVQSHEPLL
jgi:hypothetical protein